MNEEYHEALKDMKNKLSTKALEVMLEVIYSNGDLELLDLFIQYQHSNNIPQLSIKKSYFPYLLHFNQHHETFIKMYDNNLIERNVYSTSFYNHLLIRQHPVIDSCPNYRNGLPIIDSILSNSYYKDVAMTNARSSLEKQITSSQVLAEVITVIAIIYEKKAIPSKLNFRELSIEYVNQVTQHDPSHTGFSSGYYSSVTNRLVLTKDKASLEEVKIHEFTHKAMNIIFKNIASPYSSTEEKNLFLKAKADFLHNIYKFFIKNNHNVSNISQEDNSSEIGKKLLELSMEYYQQHLDLIHPDSINILKINKETIKDTIATDLVEAGCMYENILDLLGPAYLQNYTEAEEDAELAATFAQVIVSDCYSKQTQEIIAPFAQYWHDIFTPKFLEYLGNSSSDSCSLINESPI